MLFDLDLRLGVEGGLTGGGILELLYLLMEACLGAPLRAAGAFVVGAFLPFRLLLRLC